MKLFLLIACILACSSPTKCEIFGFIGDMLSTAGDIAGGIIKSVTTAVDPTNQGQEAMSSAIQAWIDLIMDAVPSTLDKLGLHTLPLLPLEIVLVPSVFGVGGISASIYDSSVDGVHTFHRVGPTAVEFDQISALVSFDAGLDNTTLNASMQVNFFSAGPPVHLSGNVGNVQCKVVIRVGTGILGPYANLEVFEIVDLTDFTLNVDGLGYLVDMAAEQLSSLIFAVAKQPIADILEKSLRDAFNQLFANPPGAIPFLLLQQLG